MDEPFSSQDTERRVQLAHEVREILKHDGVTAMLVTHDQHEAFAIADNIGVINDGELPQWDGAYDLYHKPVDRFVADLLCLAPSHHNHQVGEQIGVRLKLDHLVVFRR